MQNVTNVGTRQRKIC